MTGPRSPLFTSVRYAKKRRWSTAVRYLAFALAAVLVLVLAGGLALWRYASSRIQREDIPALAQPSTAPSDGGAGQAAAGGNAGGSGNDTSALPNMMNALVVGTDSRAGLTDQDLQELGTQDVGTNLTDTIMLVQITPAREHAAILSFPRDLKVHPPGAKTMKINAVYETGGPDLLVRTIEDLTGVQIDHYVEVDLAGFIQLTDAIGGVEICLDKPKVDKYAGVNLPAGCQTLTGKQAVGFVRSRHSADRFGPDNDFGRIARQQYFIKQAMKQVTSAGTLLNPLKIKRLINVVANNIKTDTNLGVTDMYRLANALKSMTAQDVATRLVPGYWSSQTSYTEMYPEKAEALFQAFRQGTPLPDVGMTDPHSNELTAQDVHVMVLNGVGTGGLAAKVADFLKARGFAVAGTGNAGTAANPDFSHTQTLISYGPDGEAKAKLLATFVPNAKLEQLDADPDQGDVVLTVGSDWQQQ